MKAPKISFVCRECGYTSIKWLGKCPDCASGDSFDEIENRENTNTKARVSDNKAEKFLSIEILEILSNLSIKIFKSFF